MPQPSFDFGMIGLGVMGSNLLLNMADHGYAVLGYDKDLAKTAALEKAAGPGTRISGVNTLEEFAKKLAVPRKIMMLVPAGKAVDEVIEDLLHVLQPGDIVVDGGNSHYTDTLRRIEYLQQKKLHFVGMGISGGEKGARTGPSIMPGGDPEAWLQLKPLMEAVAAKVNGEPCVDYMGKHAAGHYVKMVHNGIEYAIMQIICECYHLLHAGGGMDNDRLHDLFTEWNQGPLQGYLVEITANIFKQEDKLSPNRLLDMILDKAGAKGTGKWTSMDALDRGVPIPSVDMAVSMRNLSDIKDERIKASALYPAGDSILAMQQEELISRVHDSLLFGMVLSYAQGLSLLHRASLDLNMEIPIPQVLKIWRGGCIIRSALLEDFRNIYEEDSGLPSLLLHSDIASLLMDKAPSLRTLLAAAITRGHPSGALMSALAYFDAYRSEKLPANLLQAQRDYFGAHTYQRIDRPGVFHTEWEE